MKMLAIALAAVPLAVPFPFPAGAVHALPVFDGANYAQNLLIAARTLQQINQQIQSLQNEAQMLAGQARNLRSISFSEIALLDERLRKMNELIAAAKGIDFRLEQLDRQYRDLFPESFDRLETRDARIAAARDRLEAEMASFRQAMALQSAITENVRQDAATLRSISEKSQGAEGSLAAAQATNQLLVLAAKQQFQIQQLMATQFRADATERARQGQMEREGRERTRRFLGDGKAWTAPR